MQIYKFYKEQSGKWYIDLPKWEGRKADLEMVMGADTMLEMIAEGRQEVSVTIATESFEGAGLLKLVKVHPEDGCGADYKLHSLRGIDFNLDVWLCDVTKFVFGEFPGEIYIAPVTL